MKWMNNFADELTFSAADGFVSIFQNRMTVSGHIDRWCRGETLKPLSLYLFSLSFLSVSLPTLSLSTVLWMKEDVSPNKVIRWVSASLIFILFVLGTAIWRRDWESWGGWIERGSPVDIYRSRAVITRGPMLIACTTIDIYVNERL